MSEQKNTPPRQYEGPPRLIRANAYEDDIRDPRGMPGGQSVSDRLTQQYGPEGQGWDFDTDQYSEKNELQRALGRPAFDIATEGMKNWLRTGRYETDEGIDLTGKVQRYVRDPDMGDIVVYPDGDVHAAQSRQEGGKDA